MFRRHNQSGYSDCRLKLLWGSYSAGLLIVFSHSQCNSGNTCTTCIGFVLYTALKGAHKVAIAIFSTKFTLIPSCL
jgi:hypothetical protein